MGDHADGLHLHSVPVAAHVLADEQPDAVTHALALVT